ncbi:precorrin-2 dehydrogenase/sirohydrochlorin ferrochelatase family protein [Alicyclobacillus acidocaldarius]|uniref:precorrin-2 dehydrogenase n=1 Tax=Alicyclobacillus acidocaldarius subsp. acidocaldarius (strain ATCC 27009 / DSM 446 / BCRC 14685 / JCM 5260 / KCTC 1825 / NBRC 15652 / NCIMB 11725 / NRRL B-14509 / 104-IA) TaxID=521098 RepID=C8WSE8_ALIAD|nr:NAD(P)-dependent oxidoreductase [Alicyclobacillus acidocaldarius]ACV59433.1 siroheme synthase [Alicyclobacillus acidocaldarius subsp. acidocaldarius DSM 446]
MSSDRVPIWLKPRGMPCAVIGGGRVGARRAERLARAGAKVTLVSPTLGPEATELVQQDLVTWIDRAYQPGDLTNFALAVAATDDPAVNAAVRAEARARGIWCNRADDASDSDLDFASVVRVGEISVSIATDGTKPGLAKSLREALEQDLATGGDTFIRLLRRCADAPGAGKSPPEPP